MDRRFFRQKYDAERALAQFSVTARDEVDIERLVDALLSVVRDSLQPAGVSLMLVKTTNDGFPPHLPPARAEAVPGRPVDAAL